MTLPHSQWQYVRRNGLSLSLREIVGTGGGWQRNATKNAFQPSVLAFRRNYNLLLNLRRANWRKETDLRPVTSGSSFDAKSGSQVLVAENFAEMHSRAIPEIAVKSG